MKILLAASLLAWYAPSFAEGAGKIVCWKDKSGRVMGCGDQVPLEYRDNATKELNQRGVTVNQTGAALTPEQRKALQDENARKDAEDRMKEDQRRKDKALLETFTTTREIEDKRVRDVQLLQSNIETLQANLKNSNDRVSDAAARAADYTSRQQAIPPGLQDEIDHVNLEKNKTQARITQKRQEIDALNQHYEELRRRFIELGGEDNMKSAPAPAVSAPVTPATTVPPRKP